MYAPSIFSKKISLAPLSTTEIFIFQFISLAFASQPAAIFLAKSREITGTFSSAKATWFEPTMSVAAIATEQIMADFITSSLVDCSAYVEPKLKQLLLYVVRWKLLTQRTLREPSANRSQQFARLLHLALIAPAALAERDVELVIQANAAVRAV
jgi:hypothetical protein